MARLASDDQYATMLDEQQIDELSIRIMWNGEVFEYEANDEVMEREKLNIKYLNKYRNKIYEEHKTKIV